MSTLPFAIKMLVEVRAKDEGGFENEVLYHQSVTASIDYDPLGEGYNPEALLDQVELPEVPALYSIWIVGYIEFTKYEGPDGTEHDENVYVDTSEVSLATEYERTAMEVKYDCELPELEKQIVNFHWPDQPVTTTLKEQQMEQQTAIKMVDVDSSQISQMGHDPVSKVMRVAFKNGAAYRYQNVSEELYNSIIDAPSVGKALNENIKKFPEAFPFSKE